MPLRAIVDELVSPDGAWKAEIWERTDGTLQVRLLHWSDEGDGEGRVDGFWAQARTPDSIADSIDTATAIARELQHRCASTGAE